MSVLLIETADVSKFLPVCETRFLWNVTCGIFDASARSRKLWGAAEVFSLRFDEEPYSFLTPEFPAGKSGGTAVNCQWIPRPCERLDKDTLAIDGQGRWLYCSAPGLSEEDVRALASNELEKLKARCRVVEIPDARFLSSLADLVKFNADVIAGDSAAMSGPDWTGEREGVLVHKTARVADYVAFRTEGGPVVVDEGAKIGEFALIEGPAYIGRNARIDQAKIRPGVSIGEACRIGGEVEETVVEAFSNKHHEGFLGHSYVGSWVNIGAVATTSDLKNNYGTVRLDVGGTVIDTGTNKFGSVICDYTKVAIGTMLNTGTVLSAGCNVFAEAGGAVPKFLPRFSWGRGARYDVDRFVEDAKVVMSRRGRAMSENVEKFIRSLYAK